MNRSWKLVIIELLLVIGLVGTTGLSQDFFWAMFFILNLLTWVAVAVTDIPNSALPSIKKEPGLFVVSVLVTLAVWLGLVATGHEMLALSCLCVHLVIAVDYWLFMRRARNAAQ